MQTPHGYIFLWSLKMFPTHLKMSQKALIAKAELEEHDFFSFFESTKEG